MRITIKEMVIMATFAMYTKQQIDRSTAIVPMTEYVPPDSYYPSDYRVLDCWQCFEAQGKICHDEGHKSLFHHTKTAINGYGFCCKPGYNEGYCKHGYTHDFIGEEYGITTICSQNSVGSSSKY